MIRFKGDVISLLNKMILPGIWEHDHQDNNGDAHLKAGIVGPQESFPSWTGKWVYQPGRTFFSVSLTVREVEGVLCLQFLLHSIGMLDFLTSDIIPDLCLIPDNLIG